MSDLTALSPKTSSSHSGSQPGAVLPLRGRGVVSREPCLRAVEVALPSVLRAPGPAWRAHCSSETGPCSSGPGTVIRRVSPRQLREARFVGTAVCAAFSSEDLTGPERGWVGLDLSCYPSCDCSKLNTAFGPRRPWDLIKAHLQVTAVGAPLRVCLAGAFWRRHMACWEGYTWYWVPGQVHPLRS